MGWVTALTVALGMIGAFDRARQESWIKRWIDRARAEEKDAEKARKE